MGKSKAAGIGAGLDALFLITKNVGKDNRSNKKSDLTINAHICITINDIIPNINQPRKVFLSEKITELAKSIEKNGVIQPIIVRASKKSGSNYEIVAGERRWRAAQEAGLSEIPAIIKDIDDQTLTAFSLIENIQRENLNSIEEATAYQKLINDFKLTHEEVAARVGKPRATISNFLRLLRLHSAIQQWLTEKKLDMGHAKVLLALDDEDQVKAGEEIIKQQLSVRQTENLVRKYQQQDCKVEPAIDFELLKKVDQFKNNFSQILGKQIDVKLKKTNEERGYLKLPFNSFDELSDLFESLQKSKKAEEGDDEIQ